MNIVVISGEVITKVEFKFIYGRYGKTNKHTSIARCMLKLDNESIVQICGYDNVADFMYRNLQIGDSIVCAGYLDSEGMICVEEIYNSIEKKCRKRQKFSMKKILDLNN